MYIVYSKDNCPACVNAKNLLKTLNLQFEDIKIVDNVKDSSKEISRAEFIEKHPGVRSVPYIIDPDGNIFKNLDELNNHLVK